MATLTSEQIEEWGKNLADDLLMSSNLIQWLDIFDLTFLNAIPADVKKTDIEKIIRIARKRILEKKVP